MRYAIIRYFPGVIKLTQSGKVVSPVRLLSSTKLLNRFWLNLVL